MFLIIWDIVRLIQNYDLPPEQVNCFGMVKITIINDILWFMARFFASQMEMIIVLINFWRSYRPINQRRQTIVMVQSPTDLKYGKTR